MVDFTGQLCWLWAALPSVLSLAATHLVKHIRTDSCVARLLLTSLFSVPFCQSSYLPAASVSKAYFYWFCIQDMAVCFIIETVGGIRELFSKFTTKKTNKKETNSRQRTQAWGQFKPNRPKHCWHLHFPISPMCMHSNCTVRENKQRYGKTWAKSTQKGASLENWTNLLCNEVTAAAAAPRRTKQK